MYSSFLMIQTVDIIIPIFNESQAIQRFHTLVTTAVSDLPYQFRLIYINDGSTDDTQLRLEQIFDTNPDVCIVELSRNFGHQAAISAGLDLADADVVITMDGDGEHPPAMIGQMLQLAESGYDIVIAQRAEGQKASWFKRWTSDAFYAMINRIGDTKISPGAADFRLITRPVLESLKNSMSITAFCAV